MDQLLAHLNEIFEWIKSAKDFSSAQLPLVVHEMLAWGIIQHVAGIGLSLSVFITLVLIARYVKNTYDLKQDGPARWIALCVVGSIISLIPLFINIFELLYVLSAPRLYVINQVAELILNKGR